MTANRTPWLLSGPAPSHDATPAPALVCIPHLGGNAAVFGWWSTRLAPSVRVLPVQLPGRGSHAAARPLRSIPEIVDAMALAIAPELAGRYALYGHSFGALVAFEFARLMGTGFGRPPEHLFVGACRPPDVDLDRPFLHDAPDLAILEYLRSMDGTPDSLMADAGLRAAILPAARADLEAWETYRFVGGGRMPTPITAVAGAADPGVTAAEMRGWARQTSGAFRLVTVPGGHFFIRDARDEVVDLLASAMGSETAA